MLHYRFAEEKDLQDCVELLTDSFFDYPYFSNFIEENEKRRDFVRSIQSIAVGCWNLLWKAKDDACGGERGNPCCCSYSKSSR